MRVSFIMPHDALDELVFALGTSLYRVTAEDLSSPTAKNHWLRIHKWIDEVDRSHRQVGENGDFVRVRPFPISGAELHALQLAVDRVSQEQRELGYARVTEQAEQLHQTNIACPPATPLSRLHRAAGRVHLFSMVLVAVLALSLALNLVELFVLRVVAPVYLIWANVVMISSSLLAWAVMHQHLVQHRHLLHWHFPIHIPKVG